MGRTKSNGRKIMTELGRTAFRRMENSARQSLRLIASGAPGKRRMQPINARTDVFFQRPREQHNDAMVVEAIERACAYAKAGADGLFAPGLADISLIAHLAEKS